MSVQSVRQPTKYPQVRINRAQLLDGVKHFWPDKQKFSFLLAAQADGISRQCPAIGRWELVSSFMWFALNIERAATPEACVEAYVELVKHLACPEPGWEGADVVFEG